MQKDDFELNEGSEFQTFPKNSDPKKTPPTASYVAERCLRHNDVSRKGLRCQRRWLPQWQGPAGNWGGRFFLGFLDSEFLVFHGFYHDFFRIHYDVLWLNKDTFTFFLKKLFTQACLSSSQELLHSMVKGSKNQAGSNSFAPLHRFKLRENCTLKSGCHFEKDAKASLWLLHLDVLKSGLSALVTAEVTKYSSTSSFTSWKTHKWSRLVTGRIDLDFNVV